MYSNSDTVNYSTNNTNTIHNIIYTLTEISKDDFLAITQFQEILVK